MDDCLPSDTTFPGGGCVLKPHQGDVSNAEFGQLLSSALQIQTATGLVPALIGHPSWRNEPSHVTTPQGKLITISNRGGRAHTFTEVEHFGGGRVTPLNVGLQAAPECNPALTVDLPPGASTTIAVADPGLHKFQCCIHPWMRATIRVE
jgi:plastocyanin